jgi:fucose 4-O-acetylase-like acetyltransferase
MQLFEKKAIKKLIEYKWPLTKEYVIKKLFIPFMVFQLIYLVYMNQIYYDRFWIKEINEKTGVVEYKEELRYFYINIGCMAVLFGYGIYFCSTEMR